MTEKRNGFSDLAEDGVNDGVLEWTAVGTLLALGIEVGEMGGNLAAA